MILILTMEKQKQSCCTYVQFKVRKTNKQKKITIEFIMRDDLGFPYILSQERDACNPNSSPILAHTNTPLLEQTCIQ